MSREGGGRGIMMSVLGGRREGDHGECLGREEGGGSW